MSTVIKGRAGAGGFPRGWKDKQVGVAKEDITKDKAIAAIPTLDWGGDIVDYLDIPNSPDAQVYVVSCLTGEYIAVRYEAAPYLKVYKRSGQTITELSISVDLSSGIPAICFSPDGTYLAVSRENDIVIYKRSGDAFTELSTPTLKAPDQAISMSFSPNANYLAAGFMFAHSVKIYKRSGDNFTELSNAITISDDIYSVGFSPDGIYLAVGISNTLLMFKRSGDVFNQINTVDASDGTPQSLCFSPDGTYLASGGDKCLEVYKRIDDTFTKLSSIILAPSASIFSVNFSPDGNYLAAGHSRSPFLTVCKRDGDTFVRLNTPMIAESNVYAVCFSLDGKYLYVGKLNEPYFVAYSVKFYCVYNANGYIKLGNWESDAKLGIALENAETDAKLKINLFPAVNTSNP
ncbi:WD40 repeat domain-containing protein [Anaeromassilibacillus senegalensis]|uniref:WD40 repeat domain-containing protein n=1 Tax=Anaeromassilibacillus senegalensis TaxID=1673717 RepID=UPI0006819410|nr:WD40 repeat domain-containing protein [Anaeromassilibacillus senegalensis]